MIETLFKFTPRPLKQSFVQGWELSRTALYLAESLPLLALNRSLLKQGFESAPPDIQKTVVKKLWSFLEEDAELFASGVYPPSLLRREDSPTRHFSRYLELLVDSVSVTKRKAVRETKFFSDVEAADLEELPEYYKRNFHHQTDGYLSRKSARLYGHQVEILFRGAAAAMRRRFLVPMKEELPGQGRGLKILDVACGAGDSTRILQAAYPEARIEGLDLSDAYLLEAQSKFKDQPRVHFAQGRAEELPYKDGHFDALLSVFLFHEIPHEIRIQCLKEALRVLKPGGYFIQVDSIQLHDDKDLEWSLKRFPVDFHEPFYRNYVENPVEDLASRYGFRVVQKELGFFAKTLVLQKPEESEVK